MLERATLKLTTCKIIVAGDGRAGKTSLLRNLRREPFDPEEESTRGVAACTVDVREESWDVAGGSSSMGYESKLAQVYRRDHQQPEGKAEPEPEPDFSSAPRRAAAAPKEAAAVPKKAASKHSVVLLEAIRIDPAYRQRFSAGSSCGFTI